MNVQNPSTGPLQPNSARNDDVSEAQQAANPEEASSEQSTEATDAAGTDQVEISDAARAAQERLSGEDVALVERGRQALNEESSLSEERRAELQEQVENGRFTAPDVAQEAASALTELFG
jgi:anti-sigma28 factor (negative regulator of flagellin synthesis)